MVYEVRTGFYINVYHEVIYFTASFIFKLGDFVFMSELIQSILVIFLVKNCRLMDASDNVTDLLNVTSL